MIRDKILELVAFNAGLDIDEIDEEATLAETGLDHFDVSELSQQIEDDLEIQVDWTGIDTVEDLIKFVERKS